VVEHPIQHILVGLVGNRQVFAVNQLHAGIDDIV